MPKVERLPSGSFRVRYTDSWGRRQSIVRPTAADVRAAHRQALTSDVNPRRGRVSLEVWADDWLAGARNLSRGGHDTYRRDLDKYILPELGKVPVGRLSAGDIDRYLTSASASSDPAEKGGLAPSTVHRHYRTLHRCLAVAVERGLIARNPADLVQPPTIPRTEITVLDAQQVDALAAAISPRYRVWVLVMAYGGLRWSESVGLRRRHVDCGTPDQPDVTEFGVDQVIASAKIHELGERQPMIGSDTGQHGDNLGLGHGSHARVMVMEQLVHRGRGEWERCEPKSGSRRTVTLPAFVAGELAYHLDAYSLDGDDGLVFPTRNSTPIQAPSFRTNIFRRALTRAGLPPIRIHDLRHTAISLAIEAGANPKLSQARAGHSSIGIHLDRYGHLFPGADETIAQALDQLHDRSQRQRLRVVGD